MISYLTWVNFKHHKKGHPVSKGTTQTRARQVLIKNVVRNTVYRMKIRISQLRNPDTGIARGSYNIRKMRTLIKIKKKKPGKKIWIKLARNVSIQFNTVFENYVLIQKIIKEVKETEWNESTYRIGIKM